MTHARAIYCLIVAILLPAQLWNRVARTRRFRFSRITKMLSLIITAHILCICGSALGQMDNYVDEATRQQLSTRNIYTRAARGSGNLFDFDNVLSSLFAPKTGVSAATMHREYEHTDMPCQMVRVAHILRHQGCQPKAIPSFACAGLCASYVQVRGPTTTRYSA